MDGNSKTVGVKSGRNHPGSRRLKTLLILIIIILAGIVTAVFVNYRYSMKQAEQPARPEETTAALSISQFEHTAMKDGEREWTLRADMARLFSENRKAVLTRIETIFFMEDGERVIMNADHGEMDMASKNLQVWENVIVNHPEYVLKTESLNYKYESRIMIIDAPLEITGDTILFTADSARYEMDRKTAIFEGNIESWFNETIIHP